MENTRPKIGDKKLKAAELKILKILSKIDNLNLDNSHLSKIKCPNTKGKAYKFLQRKKYYLFFTILVLVLGVLRNFYLELSSKSCLLEVPSSTRTIFRAPEDCSMCIDVEEVTRVANLSAEEFEDLYAYGTKPVIVTDAMDGWKAVDEFSFKFFADFYRDEDLGRQTNDCFFFPYKSGLYSLQDVFGMDENRANLSGAPWYVGWSTCREAESRRLRGFYSRPYFLPRSAESDVVDWLFMGGPGQGAHMHVDSVRHTSWQAQVRGRKTWQLAPPPECLYHCRWIRFTVEPGEILVVNTNRWYHQTEVLPGDISITIGAEYD